MQQYAMLDQWRQLKLAEQIKFWFAIEQTNLCLIKLKEAGLKKEMVRYVENRTPSIGHMLEYLNKKYGGKIEIIIFPESVKVPVRVILRTEEGISDDMFAMQELSEALLEAVIYVLRG